MTRIDPLFASIVAMQPSAHRAGSTVAFTEGVYSMVDQANRATYAKGISVVTGATDGNIVVHLVDDFNAAGAKVYCTIPLKAEDRIGYVFDEILEEGTTVDLDDLTFWL